MGGSCSTNDGAFDSAGNDTDPMLNAAEGGGGSHRGGRGHNQDFGSASIAEVGAMSEQVVYLTAQNSRLSQQVEELKSKLSNAENNNNNNNKSTRKHNIGESIDITNSKNNIEIWTYHHLLYVLNKYGITINDDILKDIVKKILKIEKSSNDSTQYYNNCKKILKEFINTNEINTIPTSGIIKITLIQTGFYLEKNNKINQLRKIATIARVSDDTLKCINDTIQTQKGIEASYNQVYDI